MTEAGNEAAGIGQNQAETKAEKHAQGGNPGQGTDATSATSVRPSLLRRFLRHRTARAATVAGLVGALLGAGVVAWQTDTLPLLKPDPCWDSLDDSAVSALFGDRRLEVDEQALRRDPSVASLSYGQCRITSYKDEEARRQAIIRVHTLDGLYGKDAQRWPAEFLSSRMVTLGDGLPGMVSASRAWLALPQSCTGRPGSTQGPTVVDVALGEHDFDMQSEYDGEDRDAMTRVVVAAANGVIRELGCTGTYRTPDALPGLPRWDDVRPRTFCGVKGLELPATYRKDLELNRFGGDAGAARICDAGREGRPGIRLTTVFDPALAGILRQDTYKGGARITGTEGGGTLNPTRAVYQVSCQTGPVVFVAEDLDLLRKDANFVRDVLPAYVEAETERIGCGAVKVELP
ncbi:hypothetical protein [Streptomyces sp. NPDC058572]|uniref:hypothetical protein n=1 Tax=Streptomyces sp. NPDC058572 TaxID=3346546 RepID=UPI003655BBBB